MTSEGQWIRLLKNIMIVNDTCKVIRIMLQVVASPMIVILMTLEVSFMLLKTFIVQVYVIVSPHISYRSVE